MTLPELIYRFAGKRVLVIGDVMLDEYLYGHVERVSPEAPVPVVSLDRRVVRPGGAANVALNALGLGAKVKLVGLIGNDEPGQRLVQACAEAAVDTNGLLVSATRRTTRKARVMSQGQQLLRVDTEDVHLCNEVEFADLQRVINKELAAGWPEVVLIEDYDKGVLSPKLIGAVLQACAKTGVPTVVDPKLRNFWHYRGVSLLKPNFKETADALPGLQLDPSDPERLAAADAAIRERLEHGISLITLGKHGAVVSSGAEQLEWQAAHQQEVVDVCGAGDSVAAVVALGLLAGATPSQLLELANVAGALACRHVGVRPLGVAEVLGELGGVSVG